jgi:hypothetical protein
MKSFKVGSIVLATDQGLGYLAKSFYDNGITDKVCIQKHSQRANHYEWYRDYTFEALDLLDCDVILMFETPFNWTIIPKAREKGIKTILIPMYECTNFPFPETPDEIWCPSALDYDFYTKKGVKNCKQIQIPVDVEWKLREKAQVFVHNSGNGGLGGRNGTKELLEAMKYVKSPIKLIIRSQIDMKRVDDPRIEYRIGQFDDIWNEGDVFIFPEKFNGLSLPIQEAFASGMLVMASDRFPSNTYLPREPLIEVDGYKKESIAVEFDMAIIKPEKIANKIDEWYNLNIKKYSLVGLDYNKNNSWKIQKEKLKMLMLQ